LLAGLEPGVWADYPTCTHLLERITPASFAAIAGSVGSSAATDVTGGMASKVQQSLDWVELIPDLEVSIFSGEEPGAVQRALLGKVVGTVLCGER
jgi:isopentenyl phosphate kinase